MSLQIFQKYAKRYRAVLIFALLTALAAGFFTWRTGERYSVSLAVSVSRLGTQQASDYKYDSYYAMKASDEFGDTVAGWFKTPEMTAAVYKKANMKLGGTNLNNMARRFQASKISPNVVDVRFGVKTEEEGRNLALAMTGILQDKSSLLSSLSGQGIAFAAMTSEPVIVKNTYAIWWNALAGFLAGLVLGIFIRVAKEYFG